MHTKLSFTQVHHVVDTWMLVQMTPNYAEKVGVRLFTIFFTMQPEAISVFNFQCESSSMQEFFESPRFALQAKDYMRTFASIIDMLGPNLEVMNETLIRLGTEHKGVTVEQYDCMGKALMQTIEESIGKDEFTPAHKESWEICWRMMSRRMLHGSRKV
eukprot:scaffold158_cov105-Cylindrotheca_fusiformis.AAC.15